ncbi:MAG: hypothetical protein PVI01_16455 [Gemmatimonadales bacterium]|jgi:hypothetical protein
MQKRACFRRPGAIALVASLSLWVGCGGEEHEIVGPDPGAVEVKTTTIGQELDADGYAVSLDGGEHKPIGANGTLMISGLDAGDHEVELLGIAATCDVAGSNPRTLTVTAGGTAETTFEVTCAPITGDLEVSTSTTGRDIDPDGYAVSVDGAEGQAIAVNGGRTISGLAAGDHQLELTRVAANCTVAGSNPRAVTLTAGADAQMSFEVSCVSTTGRSSVSGQDQEGQAGAPLDDPFVVRVNDSSGAPAASIEVTWTVRRGEGSLNAEFRASGDPVLETSTRTNDEGLAQVSFMPTWFGLVEVVAQAAGVEGSPLTFRTDATDPGAALAVAFGSDQQAKAGQPLGQPFVVQVTNGQGDAVPYMRVFWGLTYGDGDFGRDELGNRATAIETRTDADGFAEASFTPTWFGPVEVAAYAGGAQGSPAAFKADATDLGATLTIVSGDDQQGKAGEPLPELFVARVADGQGNAVANVLVSWSVTQGSGAWAGSSQATTPYSGAGGLAQVAFAPRQLGTSRVAAQLAGTHVRVSFTTDVSVLLISYEDYYGGIFVGPYCEGWSYCSDETVPLGTTLEWVNALPNAARIVSTSTPPGGASFDSGTLDEDGRFQFVPKVTGTWEYVDQVRGRTGRLTVY